MQALDTHLLQRDENWLRGIEEGKILKFDIAF